MKKIICSFFGHRTLFSEMRPQLTAEIGRHISQLGVNTFYIGGYGDFDQMASGILRETQERHPHIAVLHVLAYMPVPGGESGGRANPTLYPEALAFVPKRFAIAHRNRWMVEQSDYIIGYAFLQGGAYTALQYAQQKKKPIVNLARPEMMHPQ